MRKRNKFGNVKTAIDGIKFDSKKEAARYEVLRDMAASGLISELHPHPPFRLEVNGQLVCKYIADFTYIENGIRIIEDVKSPRTAKLPAYRLKKKLMKACLNLDILET